jgi:hypothetical protein
MLRFCTVSLVLALVCTHLLTSCMVYQYREVPQLTNIPLVPHNQEVELYFGDELPENKAYYEVLGLSAGGGSDYNAMLLQLKNQANQAGVDAIIHISDFQETYVAEGGQYNVHTVKGIGIKYRDNLTYIDEYIKSKKTYDLSGANTGAPTLVYEAPFHMLGHEITNAYKRNDTYIRYVRDLSFDYLLYETINWAYRTDNQGRVIERQYRTIPTKPQADLLCRFTYTFVEDVETITIVYPANPQQNVYMELSYTSDSKVDEKLIYDKAGNKKKLLYVEKLDYDQLNRIAQTTLYKVEQGKQVPFLQTIYTYYTMDDLPVPKTYK